jgi:hypothetical protein
MLPEKRVIASTTLCSRLAFFSSLLLLSSNVRIFRVRTSFNPCSSVSFTLSLSSIVLDIRRRQHPRVHGEHRKLKYYALDYSRYLIHSLATRVFLPRRRRVDPHYPGCCRNCRDNQTRNRACRLTCLDRPEIFIQTIRAARPLLPAGV